MKIFRPADASTKHRITPAKYYLAPAKISVLGANQLIIGFATPNSVMPRLLTRTAVMIATYTVLYCIELL